MKRLGVVSVIVFLSSLAFAAPAYFVQADMVRGAQGAQGAVCVPNTVFIPGELIVFRAVVYDGETGEALTPGEVTERGITATVKLDSGVEQAMFYPPAEEGAPEGSNYFRGPWPVPADFATGMYGWTIDVTDGEGNTATFSPIGGGTELGTITIQAAAQ